MPSYIFDNSNNPYAALPSLAESKSARLSSKLQEKREKLTPAPVPLTYTPEEVEAAKQSLAGTTSAPSDSLLNMAEASLYRGAGHIADSYANVRQNVFGDEDFKLSPGVDSLSDEAVADEKAGFTGREKFNLDVQNLSESVAKGDVIDSITQGLALGPRALADSAASGVELLAGAGATAAATAATGPVGGFVTGAAIFGKKAKKAADTVDKVVTLADRIKKGAKAVPSVIAKSAGRTSLLTADLTEQMRQDYKEAHNGAEPSAAYYATNIPITIALNALEFGLISKAVPRFSKPTIKEMKESVKFMSKNHSAEAAKRIIGGVGKVISTAGAEAGQEYLQTWHEILAPVVKGDTLKELITNAVPELGKDANQNEAIVGSILGFSAGGTARGVSVAPAVATGLAKDTAAGTAKTVGEVTKAAGRGLQQARSKASLKILSAKERESIRNDYEIKKAVVDEKTTEIDEKINAVTEAETYADILSDNELAPVAKEQQRDLKLTDEDLADPGKLKTLKDRIVRKQKAAQLLLKTELEGSNVAVLTKQIAKGVKDLATETAVAAIEKVPEEVVLKTVEAAITVKKNAVAAANMVKELKSSTALGIVEMGLRGAPNTAKTILTAAKELELGDLERVAEVIKEKNPTLGDKLTRLYENKKDELTNLGQRSDDLVNKETLSPVITGVAEKGNFDGQSASAVATAIKQTLSGKIADKATLATVKKALSVYKASPAFTDKATPGRINTTNMSVLEDRLENATKRLNREVTTENIEAAVDTVKTAAASVKDKVKDKAAEVAPKVKKAVGDTVDKITKATAREKKVLPKSKASTAITSIIAGIKAGQSAEMIAAIPTIVSTLQKRGYDTLADFNDLIEQFPGLTEDNNFLAALKSRFATETDVIMEEDTDRVESDHADSNVAFKFFEAIGLTGCNK